MNKVQVLTASAVLALSAQASASLITDVAGNSSTANAYNIDAYFSLDTDLNITDSSLTPHVSIFSDAGQGDYDYFSFSATSGSRGLFDVDHLVTPGFNSALVLWDPSGTNVAYSSGVASVDVGSVSTQDAFLDYTFSVDGTYVIGIANAADTFLQSYAISDDFSGSGLAVDEGYSLQVSIGSHAVAPEVSVNESSTALLFGLGLLGFAARKKKSV